MNALKYRRLVDIGKGLLRVNCLCGNCVPCEIISDGNTRTLIGLHAVKVSTEALLRYINNVSISKMHGNNARVHVDTEYNVEWHGKGGAAHIARFLQPVHDDRSRSLQHTI
jgi:hypothetical protein